MSRACTPDQLEQKRLRTIRFAQLLAEMQAKGYSRKNQKEVIRALQALYHAPLNNVTSAREQVWACLHKGAKKALEKRYNAHKRFWEQMAYIGIGGVCAAYTIPFRFSRVTMLVSAFLVFYQVMRSNRLLIGPKTPEKGYKNRKDRKKIEQARAKASFIVSQKYARLKNQFLQR